MFFMMWRQPSSTLFPYTTLFRSRLHAVCEDYRAGAGIDRQLDEADLAAGRKIACPTFVLWGSDYLGRGAGNPLEVWKTWCTNVDRKSTRLNSSHVKISYAVFCLK